MPITAFGSLAKNFSTWPRLRLRRSTTSPAALRPCTSNTFFAMSSPIMIAFSMDGPLSLVAVCPEPVWHTDAGWGPSTPSSRGRRPRDLSCCLKFPRYARDDNLVVASRRLAELGDPLDHRRNHALWEVVTPARIC